MLVNLDALPEMFAAASCDGIVGSRSDVRITPDSGH